MVIGLVVTAVPAVLSPVWWWVAPGFWLAMALGATADALALRRARPRVTATLPDAVGVGDRVGLEVAVELGGRRSLQGSLRPEVEAPLEPRGDVETRLGPGRSDRVLELSADRRGEGAVAATWLRLDGPLGLLRRIDRFASEAPPVRVLPNFARVRRLAIQHFGAFQLRGGLKVERLPGDGSEFDALEAYSPGMDLRSVDWKASARHQAPRVRRYRVERNQRLVVCLDTGRLMADPIDGLTRLDHSIHAALLVAYAALHGGDLVGLHAYGAEPLAWVPPGSGMRHMKRLTASCAGLAPRDEETNHVRGVHDIVRRLRRRSLVVVFSDFADSTTAELMVEHVAHLARRHLVIFVALDDPVVERPFRTPPADAEGMARAVVAGDLREDRRRVFRRLRRLGVDVVHGPAGRASVDLLDRYVRFKRRGLIG
jgi:uncharacterized protein (DUF58 family)